MSTERVKGEEFAGVVTVTGGLHLASDQDVSTQQADLRTHVHAIHLLSNVKVRWFTWRTYTKQIQTVYTHLSAVHELPQQLHTANIPY